MNQQVKIPSEDRKIKKKKKRNRNSGVGKCNCNKKLTVAVQ